MQGPFAVLSCLSPTKSLHGNEATRYAACCKHKLLETEITDYILVAVHSRCHRAGLGAVKMATVANVQKEQWPKSSLSEQKEVS